VVCFYRPPHRSACSGRRSLRDCQFLANFRGRACGF
jgi:hypothetical protein